MSSSVPKLLDLLRVVSRLERKSGFSSSMGIDYDYFRTLSSTDELKWDDSSQTLTTVVPMNENLLLPSLSSANGSHASSGAGSQQVLGTLSTYQALIDDLTTWAFVLADPRRGRAGVSVALGTEWAPSHFRRRSLPNFSPPEVGDAVVIRSQVNKVGVNVGFANATVHVASTGEPLCYGSHVKFLALGRGTDFLLSSVGWPLTRLYAQYGFSDPPPGVVAPPLSKLFETLEFVSESRARCSITPSHASMGGPIHGGCQAILMEVVATRYLHQQQSDQATDTMSPPLILHSMDLEYLSKPSPKQVELIVQDILPHDYSSSNSSNDASVPNFHMEDAAIVPVRVVLESQGRVNSYGVLRFVRALAS